MALIEGYKGEAGFTMDSSGQIVELKSSYAVGIMGFPNAGKLVDYVLSNPHYAIGFWRDEFSGREHWDAVQIVPELNAAIETGKRHHQIALWDFGSKSEVRI